MESDLWFDTFEDFMDSYLYDFGWYDSYLEKQHEDY